MAGPELSYPHTATLWRPTTPDEYGTRGWEGPLAVRCRWSDRAVLFRDPSGREAVSRSVVAIEDETPAPGDYLLFGESGSLTPTADADEVRQVNDVDSIDGSWTRRRAFL